MMEAHLETARPAELFPMRLLGLGLYLAWTALIVPFEKACGVEAFSSSIARLYIYVGLMVALYVGAALYVRRTGTSPWGRASVVFCAVAAAIWPLCELAAIAAPVGGAALDIVAIAVRSVSTAGFFLMWNAQLATHKARTAWIAYAGSFALAACVYLAVGALGVAAMTAALLCLPLVSWLLLAMSAKLRDEGEEAPDAQVTWHFPWRPVALMALFSFAYFLAGHFDGNLHMPGELGRLAVSAVVLVCLLAAFDRFDTGALYKVCPALMVAGLLLCCASGYDGAGLRGLLVSMGYNGFMLYMYLVLNTVCYRFKAPAEWLFGLTEAVCIAMVVPSSTLGDWLNGSAAPDGAAGFAMGATAVTVVLLGMLLLSSSTEAAAWGIRGVRRDAEGAAGGEGSVGTSGYLEDHVYRCARVARHYGLTHREEEVMSLLAQGMSFQEVEARLCIAHGTMRVHAQHIYAKLGVHGLEEAREAVRDWRP